MSRLKRIEIEINRRSFILNASAFGLLCAPGLVASSKAAKPAPGMPLPRFFTRNDIRMAVYEKDKGIPVIFCHGFHAIAPDLRGFGLTSQPTAINDYAATEICDDLVAMMDEMNLSKAIFCGHVFRYKDN